MSSNSSNKAASSVRQPQSEAADGDQRRDHTFTRLRSALLEDRLAVMSLTEENTGTDPYNSGVHRALGKATVWNRRTRR